MPSASKTANLTAVVPVINLAKHFDEIVRMRLSCVELGIRNIFIIDNASNLSSEETLALQKLRSLVPKSEDIILGDFGNPGSARNAAIGRIDTDWTVFWDADDSPNPGVVLRNVSLNPSMDVIVGSFVKNSGAIRKLYVHNSLGQMALNPGIWRFVFKTKILENQRFADLQMGEDQIFLMSLNLHRRKLIFSNDIFYTYHLNIPGQLTSSGAALASMPKTLAQAKFMRNSDERHFYKDLIYSRLLVSLLKNSNSSAIAKIMLLKEYSDLGLVRSSLYVLIQKLANRA